MWFKKSYHEDANGLDNNMRMKEDFEDFYNEEIDKYPNNAKGFAMFGYQVHHFHAITMRQQNFLIKHGCVQLPSKPHDLSDCVAGDCGNFPSPKNT